MHVPSLYFFTKQMFLTTVPFGKRPFVLCVGNVLIAWWMAYSQTFQFNEENKC